MRAQKYVDNAVPKTVNLPPDATVEDVSMHACMKCKGTTIYRYGNKKEQVLYVGPLLTKERVTEKHVSADSEYSGGCPTSECPF